jgi:tetratricopeptide (TPR) repeat protein
VALLQSLGVRGSLRKTTPSAAAQTSGSPLWNEYEKLVEDVQGHALTLNLLGSYLRDAHAGDIRKCDLINLKDADAASEHREHAWHVMDAYVRWMAPTGLRAWLRRLFNAKERMIQAEGKRALALLQLLGLFDRPATADCLKALWQPPAIAGLTEPLIGISEAQRNLSLKRLEDAKLLTVNRAGGSGELIALDAHPLLREYFAQQLRAQQPDAWRAAHWRLYEHLCATTPDNPQPMLEDLQPFYQAVGHGCQAGRHCEAWDSVYEARIARCDLDRTAWPYSARVLGAWGNTLSCLGGFFDELWDKPASVLSNRQRSLVLQQAGWLLRGVGRFSEATTALEESRENAETNENWHLAGVACRNLNQLYEVIGDLRRARRAGEDSVIFAKRSGQATECTKNISRLAGTLHMLGELAAAEECFRSAGISNSFEQVLNPRSGYEFFLFGDLMVSQARYAEARQVADNVLTAARTIQVAPVVPALAYFVKGRAYIAQSNLGEARECFNLCMNGLRENGELHQLPRGLLGRA